jgi:hypothetical protein
VKRLIVILFSACIFISECSLGAGFVKSTSFVWFAGAGTSEAITLTGVTVSDLLVICVFWNDNTQTISTISGNGNVYMPVDTQSSASFGGTATYYVKSAVSGNTTITVSWGADPSFGGLVAHEVSGMNTSAPLDQHIINTQVNPGLGTDAITSTAKTPVANGEYIFGCNFDNGGGSLSESAGTNFTIRENNAASLFTASEDLGATGIQSTAANIAATFTTNPSETSAVTALMTFKQPAVTASASNSLFKINGAQVIINGAQVTIN